MSDERDSDYGCITFALVLFFVVSVLVISSELGEVSNRLDRIENAVVKR